MKKRTNKTQELTREQNAPLKIDPTSFLYHPHDKFLKYIFSIKEVAIEFLRFSLPEETYNQLDADTFEPENGSFIDKKMKSQFADTVFSIKARDGDTYRVSLIWEFKGDLGGKPIAVQLLGYAHASMEYDLKQKRTLRPPLSIVVYHGIKPTEKTTLQKLFESTPSALKPFIPNFDYILLNINEMSDEQILKLNFAFLPNILMVLKNGRDTVKVVKYFENMFIFANEKVDIVEAITEITLLYLSIVSKIKLEDMEILIEKLPKSKAKIVNGTFVHALLEKKS